MEQLADLVHLKEVHGLEMDLSTYNQISKTRIAIMLLERETATETLQFAIDNHFMPYLIHHDLGSDDVLSDYATELLDVSSMIDSASGGPSKEERISILLQNIKSPDIKSEIVLQLLRQTSLPWSERVNNLIDGVEALNGSRRYTELLELKKLMELKRTLFKYDVVNFNISDLSMANGTLNHYSNA
jgi:hypothetical protein